MPGREVSDTAEQRYVRLFDMNFLDCTLDAAADLVIEHAMMNRPLSVMFVNAHCVNVSRRDPEYRQMLENADLVFADGSGMSMAARMLGTTLDNNVNGTDLFPVICQRAAARDIPVALMGAAPGIAEECGRRMMDRFPGLRVSHSSDGYLNNDEEMLAIADVNGSGAQIVFCCPRCASAGALDCEKPQ